jgi:hypothetical protein
MTLHAWGTSTSRIAFRFTRRAIDLEPRVATSLHLQGIISFLAGVRTVWGENLEYLPDGRNAMLG